MKLCLAILLLPLCILSGCATAPEAHNSEPANALVNRFFEKRAWNSDELCSVDGIIDNNRKVPVKRFKHGDSVTSVVPSGSRLLVLGVLTSSDSVFRAFGHREIGIRADLQPGETYDVRLLRSGDQLQVWIINHATGRLASEKLSFDVHNPIIIPTPIPI